MAESEVGERGEREAGRSRGFDVHGADGLFGKDLGEEGWKRWGQTGRHDSQGPAEFWLESLPDWEQGRKIGVRRGGFSRRLLLQRRLVVLSSQRVQ